MKNKVISALSIPTLVLVFSAYDTSMYGTVSDAAANSAKGAVTATAELIAGQSTSNGTGHAPNAKLSAAHNMEAYVIDKDPQGLNVRDTPDPGRACRGGHPRGC
jgi:hypothetical protein